MSTPGVSLKAYFARLSNPYAFKNHSYSGVKRVAAAAFDSAFPVTSGEVTGSFGEIYTIAEYMFAYETPKLPAEVIGFLDFLNTCQRTNHFHNTH